jgi:translation initiation factor IF-1
MLGNEAFQVEGVVIESRPNRTFCVELANGHRLTAFETGQARKRPASLAPGDRVKLQLTPYDLSVGRILVEKTKTIGT